MEEMPRAALSPSSMFSFMSALDPMMQFIVLTFIFYTILAFTTGFVARDSILRWGILSPVGLVLYEMALAGRREAMPTNAVVVGSSAAGYMLMYIEQVLLNRWTFEAHGPTSTLGGLRPATSKQKVPVEDTFRNRLSFGWRLCGYYRYANTPWPVKGIPPFDPEKPKEVPSRSAFFRSKALSVIFCMGVIEAVSLLSPPKHPETLFSKDKTQFFSRLDKVTAQEVILRMVVPICFWGLGRFRMQLGLVDIPAIVQVATGVAEVADFPPAFGSMSDLCSVRGFWGTYWHQTLRRRCSAPAHFVVYEVLGLRHGRLLSRYLYIFLTFVVSGVLHLVGSWAIGVALLDTPDIRFFGMQTLGIIIEDAAIAIYRRVSGSNKDSVGPAPLWAKVLGFVWLLAFEGWTMPPWIYPAFRRSNMGGVMPEGLVLKHLLK